LARYSLAFNEYNNERRRQWAIREEEERRRRERELEKQQEQERFQQLEMGSASWRKSNDIRKFVSLVNCEAGKRVLNDEQKERLDNWIE
jgi:SLT domain-containing protein